MSEQVLYPHSHTRHARPSGVPLKAFLGLIYQLLDACLDVLQEFDGIADKIQAEEDRVNVSQHLQSITGTKKFSWGVHVLHQTGSS
jgi:hypothetical protein